MRQRDANSRRPKVLPFASSTSSVLCPHRPPGVVGDGGWDPLHPALFLGVGWAQDWKTKKSNLNKFGSLEPTKHNRKRVCTRNRAAAWEEPKGAAAHRRQAQAHVTCGAARASWKSHRGRRGTAGAQAPGRPGTSTAPQSGKAKAGAREPGSPGTSTAPQGGQGRGRGASAWETQAPAPANLSQGRPKASPLGGQRRRRSNLPLRCAHKVRTAGLHMSKTQSWTFNCKQ